MQSLLVRKNENGAMDKMCIPSQALIDVEKHSNIMFVCSITTLQKSTNNSYHILEICQINIPNIQIEEGKQIYNVCIDINK